MEEYQKRAWGCLLDVERKALYLNFSQGLSSRKSGEVLKVAHYKYLEIKSRAERLFKLFSDYFSKYPDLVDPNGVVSTRVRDYIYAIIYNRKTRGEAVSSVGDSSWLLYRVSNRILTENLQRLKDSKEGTWDRDLYRLLVEFDRWNNFRVIPRPFQAISAFTRKNQKKYKSYVSYLHRIPDSKIRSLVDQYWSKGIGKRYYVTFLSESFDNGYIVVPLKENKTILQTLTQMRFYIFNDIFTADLFGILLIQFPERTMNRKDGLSYWKEYRGVIEKAINYEYINNLDFGYITMDKALGLSRKKFIRSISTLNKVKKARIKAEKKKQQKLVKKVAKELI